MSSCVFDELLLTKLEIPRVGRRIIPRHRLTKILNESLEKQLTLITAPTGYGKTTLLIEWLSDFIIPDYRIIWLSIDEYDNEPFRLWSYITTAINRIYPRFRFDPQKSFQNLTKASPQTTLTPLFNAITQIPYQLILVLDDYQFITEEQIHEEFQFLLNHQPKNLHLLVSSRTTPPLRLSRLRAQRQLVELTSKDLSFTLEETKNFFSSAMKVNVDHEQTVSLMIATEGWIAGLQLATLSLQEQSDQKAFIAKLPEENYQIFEYLTEEVLDQQKPELRDFLLKTSHLSKISAPLCNAILERDDSQDMLDRIQQANLFIVPLDEHRKWYSYHRLFADALQKYLQTTNPEIIPDLHRKACDWFQKNGFPDQAVSHALDYNDVELAAKIIDACALQAVISFELNKLVQYLSRFSNELISKRPQLGVYKALANFLLEHFDVVEPTLQSLEQILDKKKEHEHKIDDEELIRWEIEAIRTCLGYWQGNCADSPARFAALMKNRPKEDIYFTGLTLHNLAEAYAVQGYLEEAIDAYTRGCQFAIEHNLLREYCYSMSELTYIRKLQGHLHDARQDYQKLIEHALFFELPDDIVAFAKIGIAEIALEQNDVAQADQMAQWVIENFDRIEASPLNWIRQEWLFIRLADYFLARQDIQNSLVFFDRAISGLRDNEQVIHYISSQLIDFQVKLWSVTGELSSKNLRIEQQLDFLDPAGRSKQARQTALVRYHMAHDKNEKALNILSKLIPELKKNKVTERLMEALVLQSLTYQAIGKQRQALESLHQALQIALPESHRRVFTTEGDPMKSLLELYIQQPQDSDIAISAPLNNMAKKLISEIQKNALPQTYIGPNIQFTKDLNQPLLEPFSHREMEVLRLIANGKSTKEISLSLNISINTTKVHIKNMYRKSGTHTRSVLIKRAKKLGIL